jgi:hypothetical protein
MNQLMNIATTSKGSAQPGLSVPRFCTAEQLAAEFGFSVHWIYRLSKRGKGPPRLKGVRPYRYDTQSKAFKRWLEGMGVDTGEDIASVDIGADENV